MKIKKKDLRKGEAQLPINYPAPDLDDVFAFSLEEEKSRVENLCRRLAHNEAQVREAVLAELPRYVQEVTQRAADVERRIGIAALQHFTRMQRRKEQLRRQKGRRGNKGNKGNKGSDKKEAIAKNTDDGDDEDEVNVLRALDIYRDRTANVSREQRRRLAIQQLQQSHSHEEGEGEGEEETENGVDCHALSEDPATTTTTANNGSLRQQYRVWVAAWAEAELLLLKLSRGLFFCLWHTDKPLVQLDCARRIAHLITAPQDMSGKVLLFSCLMRILAREWRTMDRYRSDKFLALVRRLVNECAVLMKSAEAEALRVPQGNPLDRAAGSEKQSKASRKRKNPTAQKRKRGEEEEEEEEENKTVEDVTKREPLRRLLGEACYVFRAQIVPDPSAVGLAMHIADVLFDEICRAALSPRLFVALSDRIALYAMSRGNYVEKRVLDHFIAPMAGGRLAAARLRADTETETDTNKETKSASTTTTATTTNAIAVAESEAEANVILLALAERCRHHAVARRTVRAVRVMFTESELALRQAADPAAYEEDTRRAGRRRLEREVTEVDETRRAVIAERRNVRMLRQQEKRKTSGKAGGAEDMGSGKKTARKAKVAPRDTKRKKHYKLTKEDLYGEE